jgi:hypothetical protein
MMYRPRRRAGGSTERHQQEARLAAAEVFAEFCFLLLFLDKIFVMFNAQLLSAL